MAQVTLQLIEGLERGQMFRDLPTPVTLGREDENTIRLNDDRVSRFHAKIQEDGGQVILTDLESTNGTRVNGHPTQMRVLQLGDQIAIGRCLILFGSPEQISARAAELQKDSKTTTKLGDPTAHSGDSDSFGTSYGGVSSHGALFRSADEEGNLDLFPNGAPDVPENLRPLQRAQISDYLGYCHEQIRRALHGAADDEFGDQRVMRVSWEAWQRLLKLEMELAVAMRKVADPDV